MAQRWETVGLVPDGGWLGYAEYEAGFFVDHLDQVAASLRALHQASIVFFQSARHITNLLECHAVFVASNLSVTISANQSLAHLYCKPLPGICRDCD